MGLCSMMVFPGQPLWAIRGEHEETGIEELLFQEIPVVISAGFYETERRKAPGYSIVLSAEQIESSNIRTMEDLLNFYVPGNHISRHNGNGTLVGTRGISGSDNAKTFVMWDGQNIMLRGFWGQFVMYKMPLLGDVKTVEVINGPGAIVHGSGAINGLINMIPKSGFCYQGSRSAFEYGLQDKSVKLETDYGLSYGVNKNFYVYGGGVDAKGIRPDKIDDPNEDVRDYHALTYAYPAFKVSSVWNHERVHLNAFFHRYTTDSDNSWSTFQQFQTYHTSLGVRPKYTVPVGETDSLTFLGSCLFSDYGKHWIYSQSVFPGRPDKKTLFSESHAEMKTIYKTTRFNNHQLAAGFLYGLRSFRRDNGYFEKGVTHPGVFCAKWSEFSVFSEDVYSFSEDFVMSAGVRYDSVMYNTMRENGNDLAEKPDNAKKSTMRIAASYESNPETVFRLSYQQGFRYPDMLSVERIAETNADILAAGYSWQMPDLRPEKLDSVEFNVSKDVGKEFNFNTNFFYNVYTDLLGWGAYPDMPSGVSAVMPWGNYRNSDGKVRSGGLEFVASWRPKMYTEVRLAYEHSQVMNIDHEALSLGLAADDERKWSRYPDHFIKMYAKSSFLNDKLLLHLGMTFESKVTDRDKYPRTFHPDFDSPRIVADVMAKYLINEKYSVKLLIKNAGQSKAPIIGEWPNYRGEGFQGCFSRLAYLTFDAQF